jgi:hypothetical protein
MAAAPLPLRHDEPRARPPSRLDQTPDRRARHSRLIHERDERRPELFAQRLHAARDRYAHLAPRLVVEGEAHALLTRERRAHFVGAVADDDDDLTRARLAQPLDADADDASAAERQQRLERAHAPRTPGGEQHSRDLFRGLHRGRIISRDGQDEQDFRFLIFDLRFEVERRKSPI